ncbi:MAG: hypothetical protein ACFFHV_12380 [Promethearchaeota archaeon]
MITNFPNDLKSAILEDYTHEKFDLTSSDLEIPHFIGCFIADKNGKTLIKFEIFKGALDYFLKRDFRDGKKKSCLDVELIPMFISALERFSAEINIKDLAGFKLEGKNIKLQTIFNFKYYTVIFLLNPEVNIKLVDSQIRTYFSFLFEVYNNEFQNFRKMSSIDYISHLELIGRIWLKDLNKIYMKCVSLS